MSHGPLTLIRPTFESVGEPPTLPRFRRESNSSSGLANETRLEILAVLHDWGRSMSSHDIARRFETTWQSISRHLGILADRRARACSSVRWGRTNGRTA